MVMNVMANFAQAFGGGDQIGYFGETRGFAHLQETP